MLKDKKVLILAPHMDDAEIGCGGLIAHFAHFAHVREFIFSSAAQSTIEAGHTVEQLENEHITAYQVLVQEENKENIVFYKGSKDIPVRHFPSHRQEILDEMVSLIGFFDPDIVLLPGTGDVHQDHQVIHDEGIRAFKGCSILGYEISHNYVNGSFRNDMYIPLSDDEMGRKIAAVECFETQRHRADRSGPDVIKALAMTRGAQIGVRYAEAYEVIRWVL